MLARLEERRRHPLRFSGVDHVIIEDRWIVDQIRRLAPAYMDKALDSVGLMLPDTAQCLKEGGYVGQVGAVGTSYIAALP